MRIVYAGTPSVAVPALRALVSAGHEVARVVTREDAPVGRRRTLTPSPVAVAAEELSLPLLKANRLTAERTGPILDDPPELGVVVAYGGLVREPLLSAPRLGWINLHFSLLPRWRGAAPVQHALIAGDRTTGVSVFRLVPELDAGDLVAEEEYEIPVEATAGEVLDTLAERGAGVLCAAVDALARGEAVYTPQNGRVTLAPKLSAEDGRIDWSEPSARVLDRFRGTTPEPGAWTTLDGARVKLLAMRGDASPTSSLGPGGWATEGGVVRVGTGDGSVLVERVQPAGRQAMDAAAWARGVRDTQTGLGS